MKRKHGRLKPLTSSAGFASFVIDQLDGIDDVTSRAMFGGVGLYSGGLFFGIVAADVLYLKVDDETRGDFERAGSRPFTPYAGRPTTMNYWSVPLEVLESAPELTAWARKAVAVSARAARAPRRPARPRAAARSRSTSDRSGRSARRR